MSKSTGVNIREIAGQPLLNRRRHPGKGVWSAAAIELCGVTYREENDELCRYPDQWAWFLWNPCRTLLPFRLPTGWGITTGSPFDELVDCLKGAPVYFLDESQTDWLSLLPLLMSDGALDPHLDASIRRLLNAKTRQRYQLVARTHESRRE
jgi:hypothetical protein